MDTMAAYARGMANRGNPCRVFDWNKAAAIIRDRKAADASAGLSEDFEWTGGRIFANGLPVLSDDTYTYLASTWATPVLVIDGDEVECWAMEGDTPGWDASTYWPESARELLGLTP